jgi:hypothetical protein
MLSRVVWVRGVMTIVGVIAGLSSSLTAGEPEAFFPLMPWNWPPADATALARLHDCGMTVAGFVPPSALDLCQAAGLKAIVSDPRANSYDWMKVDAQQAEINVASLVASVSGHPAVVGYYLMDEPVAPQFDGLAIVAGAFRKYAPDKWAYINLFPCGVNYKDVGVSSYEDYLERFIGLCKPKFLSYDHYALGQSESLRRGYLLNLEQMRTAALKHEIPFWNIVASVAAYDWREPTAADLRFEAYSTLAYGGRGLCYFEYFTPPLANYRMGPIDQYGHETPTWYFVQNVNMQVQKLAPTLLQLTSTAVYYTGDVPEHCHGPGEDSLIEKVPDADYLVGEFQHADGSRYVMLVNKDLTYSHHCSPVWRNPPTKVQRVSPSTGALEDYGNESQWLAPGQGALVKVE